MLKLGLIFLGGGIGAALRYLVSVALPKLHGDGDLPIPGLATLIVNVVGCAAIGALAGWSAGGETPKLSEEHRLILIIGLLGGFTTFSTYAFETIDLANHGHQRAAIVNVVLSNVLGIGAAWLAFRLTHRA